MSRTHTRVLALFAPALLLLSAGCASNSTSSGTGGASSVTAQSSNPPTTPSASSTASSPGSDLASTASAMTGAAAAAGAASLFNALGGASGVQALADAFGTNLNANATLASLLGASGIESAKTGLVNSIAQAGGQKIASDAVDLLHALNGKGLDAGGIAAVSQALLSAGTSRGLQPDQMASLAALWDPIGKTLTAGR